MKKFFQFLAAAFAIVLLAVTAVSLAPSDTWFIRAVDVAREPLMALAGVLAQCAIGLPKWRKRILTVSVLVVLLNLWRIWPYSWLAPAEIDTVPGNSASATMGEAAQCFTAYALNVKMENRDYAPVIEQVRAADADIVLLMETDRAWAEALRPALGEYPAIEEHPQDDTYGMVFATRLDLQSITYRENTSRNTPTLYAMLGLPNGDSFEFIGLHPKPPLPGQDTGKRDANIARAGSAVPRGNPAIVMGDFNDVPWSRTTTRFREEGGWVDPRIGRGTYPTFPASYVPLGWPLDQVMVKGGVRVADFTVMPATSADHRAMKAEFCFGEIAFD